MLVANCSLLAGGFVILLIFSSDGTISVHNFSNRLASLKKDVPTPLHKLQQNLTKASPGKQKVCLLSTGAFSPPHLKHLQMLETG